MGIGVLWRSAVIGTLLATAGGLLLAAAIYMSLVPSPRIWMAQDNLPVILATGAAMGAAHGVLGSVGGAVLDRVPTGIRAPLLRIRLGAAIFVGAGWCVGIVLVGASMTIDAAIVLVPIAAVCTAITAGLAGMVVRRVRDGPAAAARS